MAAGIEVRHARSCRSPKGGRCNCEPTYRAALRINGERRRYAATSRAEVEGWLRDAKIARRRGQDVQGKSVDTLRTVVAAWREGAESGVIRERSGDVYKPAAVRSYEAALRLRVLPTLGDEPIADIRRTDLQDLVDGLVADGLAASTVQMTIVPLKAIFKREVSRGRLSVNPTVGLDLPAVRSTRDRIASPVEAAALLAAVPDDDRAIWATAMYAGLRRGELMALRVESIDLKAGVIHVVRGWDAKEGEIATKGKNRRKVPIGSALREHLLAHLMRSGRRDGDLVFGRTPTLPFAKLADRADAAWESAELKRITPHECRHSFASLMIAAGVNGKALQTYMGHASIQTTFDLYGHLMPGNEDEAAGLLDTYLSTAIGAGA
jgi:integrase